MVLYHSFVNRGFFHGPWLPVYGSGAVLLELVLQSLLPQKCSGKKHVLLIFILSSVSCSVVEYLLGAYLEWRYQIRYWDYRDFPFQINGRVCLYSFLCFGVSGILLHRYLFPAIRRIGQKLTVHTARTILMLLLILFLSDLIYSCHTPNTGSNITFPVSIFFRSQSCF